MIRNDFIAEKMMPHPIGHIVLLDLVIQVLAGAYFSPTLTQPDSDDTPFQTSSRPPLCEESVCYGQRTHSLTQHCLPSKMHLPCACGEYLQGKHLSRSTGEVTQSTSRTHIQRAPALTFS